MKDYNDTRIAHNFSDDEREIFLKTFYNLWDSAFNYPRDEESPCPWGAPWYHGHNQGMVGETIEEMAKNWFEEVKHEIAFLIEEEKSYTD